MVIEHGGKQQDVDVPLPRRVGMTTFLLDVRQRVGQARIETPATILDALEHSRPQRKQSLVAQLVTTDVRATLLPVELDAGHEVYPVELLDWGGLRWHQKEEAGWQLFGGDGVEHADRSELCFGEFRPLILEQLLGRRRGHWLDECLVLRGGDNHCFGPPFEPNL